VVGHTDSDGDNLYNKELSMKRAASVKNYLISRKIKNKITAIGKGEKSPIVKNNSDVNKRKNRRVEIFINPKTPN
jgi:outer membrane protein OmpA-like peptidoglycan-associated protein